MCHSRSRNGRQVRFASGENDDGNSRRRLRFPDGSRCCAPRCIATGPAPPVRDRFDSGSRRLSNDNPHRCRRCCLRRQTIAPKNLLAFHNRTFQSSVAPAPGPDSPVPILPSGPEMAERRDSEPRWRVARLRFLAAEEFPAALLHFFSSSAQAISRLSPISFSFFLWVTVPSSTIFWAPV